MQVAISVNFGEGSESFRVKISLAIPGKKNRRHSKCKPRSWLGKRKCSDPTSNCEIPAFPSSPATGISSEILNIFQFGLI